MSVELWQQCIDLLRDELPAQQFNTWIRPLQVEGDEQELRVYAPNRFVLDWVNDKYLSRLLELLGERCTAAPPALSLLIGSRRSAASSRSAAPVQTVASPAAAMTAKPAVVETADSPAPEEPVAPLRGERIV